jgi:hypothetical protein
MAEDAQLLRLAKAFTKIKSRQTGQEVIEFVEAALELEEICTELGQGNQ